MKHESLNKKTLELGKFLLYFSQNINHQTVGTEFALDWQKKVMEAKFGFAHKINDDTSAKMKISHAGQMDMLLKHKLNSNVTIFATTGCNVKNVIAEQKMGPLPYGVTFDIKF